MAEKELDGNFNLCFPSFLEEGIQFRNLPANLSMQAALEVLKQYHQLAMIEVWKIKMILSLLFLIKKWLDMSLLFLIKKCLDKLNFMFQKKIT